MLNKDINIYLILALCFNLFTINIMHAASNNTENTNNNVIIKATDITVQTIFNSLQKQTNFTFSYGNEIINDKNKYTVNYNDVSINYVLQDLSRKANFSYVIKNRNVLIKPRELKIAKIQQTIKGIVLDDTKTPLLGASIQEKGTKNGVTTDFDGNYTILVSTEKPILVFSYMGFKTQEIAASGKNIINIEMEPDNNSLDEVVVVGYATKKKVNLTGAVSFIDSKALENRPITNLSQGLQGQLPNVQVNFSSGRPDESAEFNIRGLGSINGGSPLILIDGTPGNIATLNPSDIASVSVLKDAASASIYGARGAFGVVLITTKEGKQEGIKVTYDSMYGLSSPTVIPNLYTEDVVNYAELHKAFGNGISDEQLEYLRERAANPSLPEIIERIDADGNPYYLRGGNTDWYGLMYQKNAPMSIQNIGVSGKSDKFNYYLSGGTIKQEGMFKMGTDHFKRYNIRSKITAKITDWLSLTTNTEYSNSNYNRPHEYVRYNLNVERLMSQEANPYNVLKNPDGTWTQHGVVLGFMEEGGRQIENQRVFKSIFSTDMSFFKNTLKVHADYTYQNDNTLLTAKRIAPLFSSKPGQIETYAIDDPNSFRRGTTNNDFNVFNIHGTYAKVIGKHDFSIMAGFNQEEYKNSYYQVLKTGQLSDNYSSLNIATGDTFTSDKESEYALRGSFFRASYNFDNRYLVELNGRYDLSSKFPSDNRGGFFPSISGAWRVSQEEFFQNADLGISNLKVRASYGALGNQNVSDFLYITNLSIQNNSWLFNGNVENYASIPSPISPNITWEEIKSANFGLDVSILNNRLNTSFDFFERKTLGMLIPSSSLPSVFGANTPKQNSGDLQTKGWELTLGWKDNIKFLGKDFSYYFNGNIGDAKSNVASFDSNLTKSFGDFRYPQYYEGMNVGDIWGYTSDGYFQSEEDIANSPDHTLRYNGYGIQVGSPKYVDINGDGIIDKGANTLDDHGDLTVIGNTTPRYTYGFGTGFNWNNFDVSVFFQGVGKRDFMPNNEAALYYGAFNRKYQPIFNHMNDFWSEENPNAAFPTPSGYSAGPWGERPLGGNHTAHLQDASYLRWKNLTVGYTLNKDDIKFIQSLRFYVSAENLMEWTSLSEAFDPEGLGMDNRSPSEDGLGMTYPFSRKVTFGLQLTF